MQPMSYAITHVWDIQGTVILGMLFHDGGFATLEEETSKAYAIIGPVGVQGGLPNFGSEIRIARWVTHEFSHTIINPLNLTLYR